MQYDDVSFRSRSKYNWDDVTPVPQYNGEPTILDLKYQPHYEELMNYFRAIIKSGEISMRVYELTGIVVKELCSNYNAWHVRQQCIEQLSDQITYEIEIKFVNKLMEDNEKTFQIWDHRKYLADRFKNYQEELRVIKNVFEDDDKNYHAWSYRIWLTKNFNLFEQEWKEIESYFERDNRNNSAWNFRFFLFKEFKYNTQEKNIQEELHFTKNQLEMDSENEAAWNYLNGFFISYEFQMFKQQPKSDQNIFVNPVTNHKFSDFPEIKEFALVQLDLHKRNRWLLNLLIDIFITQQNPSKEDVQQAITYTEYLAQDVDKIRFNYWSWYGENIKKNFEAILQ